MHLLLLLFACSSPAPAPAPAPVVEPEPETSPLPIASPSFANPVANPNSGEKPLAGWEGIAHGVELGQFQLPASEHGASQATVVRIDPRRAELVLRMASRDGAPRSVEQWAIDEDLVAAINAGMFQTDHRTNTALMVDGAHTNNGELTGDKVLLAFGPREEALHDAQIVDLGCDDLDALRPKYTTWVQGIRMLSCAGENVWSDQPKMWSHAVIGEDDQGRILFIHARSPYRTRDFVDHLVALDLGLVNLQYAEGGPEATLVVREARQTRVWIGSYETGFYEKDDNLEQWAVPNVLGVRAGPVRAPEPVDTIRHPLDR
ncbi:MAG: phosphodiester glycosidase family protein [Deltaproteobacteria bacterium]|nr:MAG: phosphodiester glycosidase family protein [Deltaproteobacteria bacterium]